jgi:hypothetical protein
MTNEIYPRALDKGALWRTARFCSALAHNIIDGCRVASIRTTIAMEGHRIMRRMLWNHYAARSPGFRPLPLSPRGESYLAALESRGIFESITDYSALADHIKERYFREVDALSSDSPLRNIGLTISHAVSFSDRELHSLLFDPELCAVLSNYYGRQPLYRDNPTVHRSVFFEGAKLDGSAVYHSDGYRQISFMLLLNDLSETDTHMQYASGSHRTQQPTYDRSAIDQEAVEQTFEIVDLVGPKGTLYVFDTEGLHRGQYFVGTARLIFHANVTTGVIPFTDQKYDRIEDIFPEPAAIQAHVREMVKHALAGRKSSSVRGGQRLNS